ncbi:carboxy-terminal kinesin 2-like [Gordionus sp. m RMFG-2023]|uniref:carboxy-terminal kinesin 2-like n=1 Tax=Gordionus sp. m RMFG-2023 TaxID=3053472 RepID=UPI0031FDCDD3
MHNEIMDLKGNIRVFCRIRPFVDTELSGVSSQNYCIYPMADDENTVEVAKFTDKSTKKIKTTELNESGALIYKYKFDKVFDHTSTQSQVYEEVSGVIQSALDGFNICVFAYGATGSGKTFTMEGNLSLSHTLPDCGKESEMYDSTVKVGDAGEPDFEAEEVKSRYGNMGLIPRAFSHIFSHLRYIKQLNSNGASETKHAESSGTVVTYELTASFIEIYNEKIRDLLWTGKQNLQPDYEIKMVDGSKSEELIIVPEVTKIKVINWKQVESILKRASKNRAVAETNLNLSSSRSHSVFQLRIDKTNLSNKNTPVTSSTLSLVDLAGSERIKQSGSTSGERLLEAKHINSSLSTLSTVITSLTNRTNKGKMGTGKKNAEIQHHVPYRNSKLTYLLKSSLGAGNSKTLMFVNVSPIEDRLEETLCSLRFAAKVNSCNIGVATVNKP